MWWLRGARHGSRGRRLASLIAGTEGLLTLHSRKGQLASTRRAIGAAASREEFTVVDTMPGMDFGPAVVAF